MVNQEKKMKRHTGLDILRIISMIMVVSLHISGYSGVLNIQYPKTQYFISWYLEALSFVGVNCFILISGFFLVDKSFDRRKLLGLWRQVISYTIGIYIILITLKLVEPTLTGTLICIFPILTKAYWFISAYFCLYLLYPYINVFIDNCKKNTMLNLIIILIILLSIIPTFFVYFDWIESNNGYSFVWFICLYLIGAYIKKYNPQFLMYKKYWYLLIYFGISLINVLTVYIIEIVSLEINIAVDYRNYFFKYNSVLVLIASISLFLFFKSININSVKSSKILKVIADLSLGVYLLHMHPILKSLYKPVFLAEQLPFQKKYFTYYVTIIIVIFALGILTEFIRRRLFEHFTAVKSSMR